MMALDQSAGESKRKRARVSLGESLDGSPKAPIGAFGGSNSALADQRAPTDDVRVKGIRPLLPPACMVEELGLESGLAATIARWRRDVARVMRGKDDRLLVIVGPCSVHDPAAALEYAARLKHAAKTYQEDLLIVMRVYFEKPRTTVGWKGLINDPDLDGSFKVNKGLRTARELLLKINRMGLPAGTEFLDTISPQYTADLVSWGAIGARTTESQVHREMSSALSMPVGFKNGTSGDCQIAVDAIKAATAGHIFLSVSKQGLAAIVESKGNSECHLILRGGSDGPNYSAEHCEAACQQLRKGGQQEQLIVDCSHGNSQKIHTNQPIVAAELARRISAGDKQVAGVMLESFLLSGRQDIVDDVSKMQYGMSVTDACMDWTQTTDVLAALSRAIRTRRTLPAFKDAAPVIRSPLAQPIASTSPSTSFGLDGYERKANRLRPLISPACVAEDLPCSAEAEQTVLRGREAVRDCVHGKDDRLLVVVGPCSVNDLDAALEYATILKKAADQHKEDLLIVMRVYFEKPRTTVGWKGLINDPDLDKSFKVNKGLRMARELLLKINCIGLPAGTEFLDMISPQYTADLVSWGAIGARTTESQLHRELASALSMPVGFKNSTSGNCQIASDAIKAASHPHNFLSVSKQGIAGIIESEGNPDGHLILRGGSDGPNYSAEHCEAACQLLTKNKLRPTLVVDCSHANSKKIHTNQPIVAAELSRRIAEGDQQILGVMLESNLAAGRQDIPADLSQLKRGVSVTDACMDWQMTAEVLDGLAKAVQTRRSLPAEQGKL